MPSKQCGFVPHLPYKTMMVNFIFQMVAMGQYIALIPRPVIRHYITSGLTFRPTDPSIRWDIAIISKKNRYCSYAATHLIGFMRDYFAELASTQEERY